MLRIQWGIAATDEKRRKKSEMNPIRIYLSGMIYYSYYLDVLEDNF